MMPRGALVGCSPSRARLVAASVDPSPIFAQYEDNQLFRNAINLAFDPAADIQVGLSITNVFENYVVTSGSTGFFRLSSAPDRL